MIQEQLAFLPEFLSDYRPSPCQGTHCMAGAAPAGKAALFAGGRSRAANAHCAPAALALAGFHPHRAAHPMGDGLLLPPGAAVRVGKCRVCGARRALSGCHCRYRMGALRGKRMAAAAHNSYIRDTPQLPLPDTTRPIVDLFAAETGALLALARYLLPDELDTAAPGITRGWSRSWTPAS